MMMKILLGAASGMVLAGPLAAQTEIEFWHAFTGRLGELVAEQVETFNPTFPK